MTEGSGGSNGAISFQTGIALTGTNKICTGANNGTISAPVIEGATYVWSNGATTPSISNLVAGQYCVVISGDCGPLAPACFTIGNYPPLPPLSILPDGPTDICEGASVELCASVPPLNGTLYTLDAYYTLMKYTPDFENQELDLDNSYNGATNTNNYGMGRNPVTNEIMLIANGSGGLRSLFSFDLATSQMLELGAVYSTGGSNLVQAMAFDSEGNLFASFNGGVINKLTYSGSGVTPMAFPVSPGLPSNGYVGLTYDFDNDRLIYATGSGSQLYAINPVSGASTFLFSTPVTAMAMEYVGDNKLYCGSIFEYGIRELNLSNGAYQDVTASAFTSSMKDIFYLPGSTFSWSDPLGDLGNSDCITVSPEQTTEYELTMTNLEGCSTSADITITVAPCSIEFSGAVIWEHNNTSGVNNTVVNLTGAGAGSDMTDVAGNYLIIIPNTTGNFILKPVKNTNKLNGLSSADVTAIQQHVANNTLLPAPFKRIAADVNKSNSINTTDATLINQALLGNPSALNQITSWRFVPASYTFPNPNVPWGFPEQINLSGVNGNVTGQDFKGIKLGDVVTTWANPANLGAGESLVFLVQDQLLEAGSELTAEFMADQLNDLNSFQFALHFDPAQLQLLEIVPASDGLPVSMDNFGTYNLAEGEIRVVWSQAAALMLNEAAPVFRLRFKAIESGARLSEVLQLDEEALPGYAYNSAYTELEVELRYLEWTDVVHANYQPVLLTNQPNPFTEVTSLHFVLPEAGEAELRISDAAGRLLFSQKKYYTAGQQIETLRLNGIGGVLFAELVTERGSVMRKMLAVKY